MSIYGLSGEQRRVFNMIALGRTDEVSAGRERRVVFRLVALGLAELGTQGAELTAEGLRLRSALLMDQLRRDLEEAT